MPDYKKMYAILCAAASEAIDMLPDIPATEAARQTLQAALSEAEELYLRQTDAENSTVDGSRPQ